MAKGGSLVRRGEGSNLKKPAKTREELESAIRMEMEDICDWPTDLAISVVPHAQAYATCRRVRPMSTMIASKPSLRLH
jgi:hypothetical protein